MTFKLSLRPSFFILLYYVSNHHFFCPLELFPSISTRVQCSKGATQLKNWKLISKVTFEIYLELWTVLDVISVNYGVNYRFVQLESEFYFRLKIGYPSEVSWKQFFTFHIFSTNVFSIYHSKVINKRIHQKFFYKYSCGAAGLW